MPGPNQHGPSFIRSEQTKSVHLFDGRSAKFGETTVDRAYLRSGRIRKCVVADVRQSALPQDLAIGWSGRR